MVDNSIFHGKIEAVNVGTDIFAEALRAQGVNTVQLNWKPYSKAKIDSLSVDMVKNLYSVEEKIEKANSKVIDIIQKSDPWWIGMKPASQCVPDMHEGLILHSGPAISWERMCKTQQKGLINGVLFEGYAKTEKEAEKLLTSGSVAYGSANDYHIVGPGSGIATPSMVVNIVEDRNTGVKGFCAPFEGPNRGGLAGWGIYNQDIHKHLHMVRDTLAPAFTEVLEQNGGLPLRRMIIRGVEMGDELHSRQDACGLILINELMKLLAESQLDASVSKKYRDLLYGTVRFFHPLGMASGMSLLEGIRNVEYSTVVTAMEGNGVDFGIKISGTGNTWYLADSPTLSGSLVSNDVKSEDVLPWIGDSCMLEAIGLGGFAAAAAPAVMRARGMTLEDGIEQSNEMLDITLDRHDSYLIPALNYKGAGIGIDFRKVIETRILPVIHGGIISKSGKRLGAGAAKVPGKCFENAIKGFTNRYLDDAGERRD